MLLEVFGIWSGEVFVILQGHAVPFFVAVTALFLFLPAAVGPVLKEVVEAIAPAVVEQVFEGCLKEGGGDGSFCFFLTVPIVWKIVGCPVIGIEEFSQAAVATGG